MKNLKTENKIKQYFKKVSVSILIYIKFRKNIKTLYKLQTTLNYKILQNFVKFFSVI